MLLKNAIEHAWEPALPVMAEYIGIPAKSPEFDPDWAENGLIDRAVKLLTDWAGKAISAIAGATIEVVRVEARTPLILIDVPGRGEGLVLLYGHLDKQPEMTGWSDGRSPWQPSLEGDKLYGRGAADDGYSIFAAVIAIAALAEQGVDHGRCVILIEACEESGSHDLPFYIEHLAERLGAPSLVVALDSGCGNYDQLWLTTSLRGMVSGILTVRVLKDGVHSGDASGVVPSSFRVLRQLLSRLEDCRTGEILLPELYVDVPAQRLAEIREAAAALGPALYTNFALPPGMRPVSEDHAELLLNRTWRPQLAVVGAGGIPSLETAGNVLRPYTSLKLSVRIPPTLDPRAAADCITTVLEADPPYGCDVSFDADHLSLGWEAPPLASWLRQAIHRASQAAFGRAAAMTGEGGGIPFMAMLGAKFPHAQFVITGVLGPGSNAHGPNEFLHVPTALKITEALSYILADHSSAAARGELSTPEG